MKTPQRMLITLISILAIILVVWFAWPHNKEVTTSAPVSTSIQAVVPETQVLQSLSAPSSSSTSAKPSADQEKILESLQAR